MSARCQMLAMLVDHDLVHCHGLKTEHWHGVSFHGPNVMGTGIRRCDHKHNTAAAAKACSEKE